MRDLFSVSPGLTVEEFYRPLGAPPHYGNQCNVQHRTARSVQVLHTH